jgi:hypothetical protein
LAVGTGEIVCCESLNDIIPLRCVSKITNTSLTSLATDWRCHFVLSRQEEIVRHRIALRADGHFFLLAFFQ